MYTYKKYYEQNKKNTFYIIKFLLRNTKKFDKNWRSCIRKLWLWSNLDCFPDWLSKEWKVSTKCVLICIHVWILYRNRMNNESGLAITTNCPLNVLRNLYLVDNGLIIAYANNSFGKYCCHLSSKFIVITSVSENRRYYFALNNCFCFYLLNFQYVRVKQNTNNIWIW